MRLQNIRVGDIVRVDKKGRMFHAFVNRKDGRELQITPIEHGISYRLATAREVIGHWSAPRVRHEQCMCGGRATWRGDRQIDCSNPVCMFHRADAT
jgi:hypothetical protein